METLEKLPIQLRDPVSYGIVYALAQRHGLTFYDAAYLDLAARERLPLASLDAQLIARRSMRTFRCFSRNFEQHRVGDFTTSA